MKRQASYEGWPPDLLLKTQVRITDTRHSRLIRRNSPQKHQSLAALVTS